MKIRVSQLLQLMALVDPVIPRRPSLPITTQVLFDRSRVLATNLDMYTAVDSEELRGLEEPFLADARGLREVLRHLPGHVMVDIVPQKEALLIRGPGIELKMENRLKVEDFPSHEVTFPADASSIHVDNGDAFMKACADVAGSAATDDSRPVLAGLLFNLSKEPVVVVTADGFRLAIRDLPAPVVEGCSFILPVSSFKNLATMWGLGAVFGPQSPGHVNLKKPLDLLVGPPPPAPPEPAEGEVPKEPMALPRYLRAAFGRVTIDMRLIPGTFPNYTQLLPTELTHMVTVDALDLRQAIKAAAKVAKESSGIIRLEWDENVLKVSARAEDVGAVAFSLQATIEGGPGKIAFNHKYLAEYTGLTEYPITIATSTPSSPALLTSPRTMRYVLMPMYLRWDGDPDPEPKTKAEEHQQVTVPERVIEPPQDGLTDCASGTGAPSARAAADQAAPGGQAAAEPTPPVHNPMAAAMAGDSGIDLEAASKGRKRRSPPRRVAEATVEG